MHTKFLAALRSDIKVEVIKFGLTNFHDDVSKPIDIEKALDQQSFVANAIQSNSTPNLNMEI